MNKARMSTFTITIQHCTGSSSQCSKARKGITRYTEWKGRSNMAPIHKWHACLHLNLKWFAKFPKTNKGKSGYKVNIKELQSYVLPMFGWKLKWKKEILFTIAQKWNMSP